jgi:hypothetical protein
MDMNLMPLSALLRNIKVFNPDFGIDIELLLFLFERLELFVSVFEGCLSVLFIKKREHRIKADLFQILQGLHSGEREITAG